jgi:hypothetical protein
VRLERTKASSRRSSPMLGSKMDPSLITALIGALAGAAIAGLFSILGGAVQTGRDHDRWVRETRYAAYSDFLEAADAWHQASTGDWVEALFRGQERLSSHEADLKALSLQLSRAQSRIVLIGPDVVRFAGAQYHNSIFSNAERYQVIQSAEDLPGLVDTDDTSGLQEARGILLALMNRAIGIGPRRRFRPKFARVE